MTIEKLEEFASNGDKHLTGLDVATGFPRADKPERPWFNKLFGDITGKINEVVDSIDELPPFDNGVLADTFVVVDGSLSQRTINKGFESIADLSTINNPKDGLRVYVKSYHAGLGKGGGYFIYDSARSGENDGALVINGWVRALGSSRLTPYHFGAKGGEHDDTDAVVNCISHNHALIDDTHKVSPFVVENVELDITSTASGRLDVINGSKTVISPVDETEYLAVYDSIVFRGCSGIINGISINEPYSAKTRATLTFELCENLDIYKPRINDGKIIGLNVIGCKNTHVYNGFGESVKAQVWTLSCSINSSFNNCYVKNTFGMAFTLLGAGYKSSSRPDEQLLADEKQIDLGMRYAEMPLPITETLGMSINKCIGYAPTTCFDINGAIGAQIAGCVAIYNPSTTDERQGQGFQIKQSQNIESELVRDTNANVIRDCFAFNTARGYGAQAGNGSKFINNTAVNVKDTIVVLNDAENAIIDGLHCYNCLNSDGAFEPSTRGLFKIFGRSHNAKVNNVNAYFDADTVTDSSSITLFDFNDARDCILSNVRVKVTSAFVSSSKFGKFCSHSGSTFTYSGTFKLTSATAFVRIIDDQSSQTVYPSTYDSWYDMNTVETGNYPVAVPERGFVCGAITIATYGSGTNAKITAGYNSGISNFVSQHNITAAYAIVKPNKEAVPDGNVLIARIDKVASSSSHIGISIRGINIL